MCVGAPCARCEPREPCEPCELELGLRRVGQPCHQAARDNLTLHHNSKLHMQKKPVSRRRASPCHASSPTFGHDVKPCTAGRCHHETLVPRRSCCLSLLPNHVLFCSQCGCPRRGAGPSHGWHAPSVRTSCHVIGGTDVQGLPGACSLAAWHPSCRLVVRPCVLSVAWRRVALRTRAVVWPRTAHFANVA